MTNGEKMQAVFPDIEMWGESKDTLDYSLGGMIHRVTKSWWNAEYKEPKTGHWIPVSERLPKRSGEYFVSVIDGSGEDNDYKAVGVAWFAHKKDYDIKESEWRELGIDETVIAWMPILEPYKGRK